MRNRSSQVDSRAAARAIAQEILLRHPETALHPTLRDRLWQLLQRLQLMLQPGSQPPQLPPGPFSGVRSPLRRGPGPRRGAVALPEPRGP